MASSSLAQSYPTKPVKLVVSFGAGGVTDVFARQLGNGLTRRLGQQVIIENKAGGNTLPATQYVANSEPDGYTLYFTVAAPFAMNPSFYKTLPYDPQSFTPVTLVGETLLGIQVPADSPFKTVQDLVKYAKENPGKLTCGSPGAASQSRLTMELFKSITGIDSLHVPYTGAANLVTAMIGHQVDWTLTDISSSVAMIKAGKVRVLAMTNSRLKSLPDVPTLAEAGFPNVKLPPSWFAIMAPPKTPPAVVARLQEEVAKEMQTPEMAAFLETYALATMPGNADQLTATVKNDAATWSGVIKQLGLTLDQ